MMTTKASEDEENYSEPEPEPSVNKKRKRSRQPSSRQVKREKISVKEEAVDNTAYLSVKKEPQQVRLPSVRSSMYSIFNSIVVVG